MQVLKGHKGRLRCLAFSPDGRFLASSAGQGHAVSLWDTARGKRLGFLSSHDDTIRVRDRRSGKTLRTLTGHARPAYGIALGRNGKLLISGSEDRTIMFWDTASSKELATIYEDNPIWSVALTPDARLLAAGVGATIKIWPVAKVLQPGARQPRRPPPPVKDKGPRQRE